MDAGRLSGRRSGLLVAADLRGAGGAGRRADVAGVRAGAARAGRCRTGWTATSTRDDVVDETSCSRSAGGAHDRAGAARAARTSSAGCCRSATPRGHGRCWSRPAEPCGLTASISTGCGLLALLLGGGFFLLVGAERQHAASRCGGALAGAALGFLLPSFWLRLRGPGPAARDPARAARCAGHADHRRGGRAGVRVGAGAGGREVGQRADAASSAARWREMRVGMGRDEALQRMAGALRRGRI